MTDDPLRMLERLPRAESDAARAARVRARCHAAMARHQPRPTPRRRMTERIWEPALVAGLCALYLSQVVRQALHLFGLL